MFALAPLVIWVDAQALRGFEVSCGEFGDCNKESRSSCFTLLGFLRREYFHPLVQAPVCLLTCWLVVEGITVPCFVVLPELALAGEAAEPALTGVCHSSLFLSGKKNAGEAGI